MAHTTQDNLGSLLFEANNDAMLILSTDYSIRSLNPAAALLLDATMDSLIGEIFPFAINPEKPTELEIPTTEDANRLFELSSSPLIWENEPALVVTLRDVTRRQEDSHEFQHLQTSLELCLNALSDAAIGTNAQAEIASLNSAAARLLDKSPKELIGQQLEDALVLLDAKTGAPIKNAKAALLAAANPQIHSGQILILANHSERPTSITTEIRQLTPNGSLSNSLIIFKDATKLDQPTEILIEEDKLHSVSLLAAGIAHDFNNILSSIMGNISVVRMSIDSDHKLSDNLAAAEDAALQARSLTQQLLAFSKGGSPSLETTTIGELVEDCARFILRGSNVKCEVERAPDLWPVDADRGQISQVLNNLIINADQAMPKGGVLKIKVENTRVNPNKFPTLSTGNYIHIEISDRGIGISDANLKRIFDPYFTTKKGGHGLGLASSFSIIKSHGGLLTAASAVGRGSTFSIYLPQSTKTLEVPTEQATVVNKPIHRGKGRILVMDDMEAMMNVAGEILSILGYQVDCSTNGQEAIDAYKLAKESGQAYDAVVFDLTVPGGMGGEEAAEILLQYDPNLIAIASSGYSNSGVMSNHQDSAFKAVVPKPYRIKEMSDALDEVLLG